VSHGVSFFFNYLGRREYLNTTPMKQLFQPYGRLVVLHITIIFGAFLVIGLGQPVLLVALLVILKTAVDLFFHLREHAGAAQPAAPPTIV
jgi:2-hydroxychromene-2-carboxylate isomerase